jgi:hypothetical protein
MEKQQIIDVVSSLGITVESVFVPFSQSRNKMEKHKTLNWVTTVLRNGRKVLSTEYSAGIAHCPSYNKQAPAIFDRPKRFWQEFSSDSECESGFANQPFTTWGGFRPDRRFPILPDAIDVLYSLIADSNVLDSSCFEDWASEYGYDADSRKGELIYRACLEIALKLRSGLSESDLALLRDALEDY